MVAALEIDRLIVGAVDVHRLTRHQAYADADRGITTFVGAVPNHDMETAIRAVWLVESNKPLAANCREDCIMRTNRPNVLEEFVGTKVRSCDVRYGS